jgi:transketolase
VRAKYLRQGWEPKENEGILITTGSEILLFLSSKEKELLEKRIHSKYIINAITTNHRNQDSPMSRGSTP